VNVPILETERLRLRGYRRADFPDRQKLWSDPLVTPHTSGAPVGEMDCWARMLTLAGHWEIMGYGYWVVEERATGRFVGEIGFADFKREIVPSFSGTPEVGWILSPEYHGKGFAAEGARAAIAWGDAHFPDPRTVCIIAPANEPSLRLAAKLGYREYARSTFKEKAILMLERFSNR
jgi:RimJ/RimL family protein N-acetyltransferase